MLLFVTFVKISLSSLTSDFICLPIVASPYLLILIMLPSISSLPIAKTVFPVTLALYPSAIPFLTLVIVFCSPNAILPSAVVN